METQTEKVREEKDAMQVTVLSRFAPDFVIDILRYFLQLELSGSTHSKY